MSKIQENILLASGLFMLIGYVLVSFFIFPYADDFTYALKGRQSDFLEVVLNERYTWNGRYSSNFLLIGHPLNWGGLLGYRLMSVILIVFAWLGLFVGFRMFKIGKPILTSTLILVAIFSSLPNVTEAFYWVCGAWTYLPAAILLFVEFAILQKKKLSLGVVFVLVLLVVIGSGFNELFSVISFCFLVYHIINLESCFKFITGKGRLDLIVSNKSSVVLAILAVIQLILLYYVKSAPGNEYRASLFSNNYQLWNSVYLTSLYSGWFIGQWLLNPITYLVVYFIAKSNIVDVNSKILRTPFGIIGVLLLPIGVACFGPIWGTGILGQHRSIDMVCFLFFPTFLLVLLANKDRLKVIFDRKLKYAFPVLIMSLFLWGNNYFLMQEYASGELNNYSKELENRIEILKECKEGDCVVPYLLDKPNSFQVYTLEADPDHWKNKSYQLFYNSGRVVPENKR